MPSDVDVAHLKSLADQCHCEWRGDVPTTNMYSEPLNQKQVSELHKLDRGMDGRLPALNHEPYTNQICVCQMTC